jgi:hypothetical protein
MCCTVGSMMILALVKVYAFSEGWLRGKEGRRR